MKVLYLGDTKLNGSASYLAGIFAYEGMDFDYLPSDSNFEDSLLANDYDAMIVSDYPAGNFSEAQSRRIVEKVEDGTGLLMIGGWDSFVGQNGGYHKNPIGQILPVKMSDVDDRVNTASPCVVKKNSDHEILSGLPFDKQAPLISGFNRLTAKDNADVLLSVEKFTVEKKKESLVFSAESVHPLLVIDSCGRGRTAAYAGDVAPHWAGGFVDWGDSRIILQAENACEVEVGNWYVKFFSHLVLWICKKSIEEDKK